VLLGVTPGLNRTTPDPIRHPTSASPCVLFPCAIRLRRCRTPTCSNSELCPPSLELAANWVWLTGTSFSRVASSSATQVWASPVCCCSSQTSASSLCMTSRSVRSSTSSPFRLAFPLLANVVRCGVRCTYDHYRQPSNQIADLGYGLSSLLIHISSSSPLKPLFPFGAGGSRVVQIHHPLLLPRRRRRAACV
jgi:hypothetical protein